MRRRWLAALALAASYILSPAARAEDWQAGWQRTVAAVEAENWHGGIDGIFLDNEKRYFLGFAVYEENIAYDNAKLIPDAMLPDMKSLADAQWEGRISMADPRAGSPLTGSGAMLRVYGE